MDRRALVAVAGLVAVAIGVTTGTGDDIKNEDGTAPTVVGTSIRGNTLYTQDGRQIPIEVKVGEGDVAAGSLRVPYVADGIIVQTVDYSPCYVSLAIDRCGESAPCLAIWTPAGEKLTLAGIPLPPVAECEIED